MIDPSEPRHIRFTKRDVPQLPELTPYDFDAEQRQRIQGAVQAEAHFGFRPFGWEW